MKKNKHDHKGTKALKLTLFFTLMLAPLLAIAFKCGYVMFNKNAYQSYSDTKRITNVQITSNTNLQNGFTYVINNTTANQNTPIFFTDNANEICLNFNLPNTYNYVGFRLMKLGNNYACVGYDTLTPSSLNSYIAENHGSNITYITNRLPLTFKLNDFYNGGDISTITIYQQNIVNESLDNAFNYAVDEMQNSELFNWTTNTLMYSPIQAMTNGMGITTPAIAILVCYWLYLTAIYIVIDIVVETFTCITHMITNKLAE